MPVISLLRYCVIMLMGRRKTENRGRKDRDEKVRRLEGEKNVGIEKTEDRGRRTVLFIDKLNYDQDVTTTGVAMSRHDMLFPEIPCRFENCKACYLRGLFVIE